MTTIVSDSFNRANSTTGLGNADTGQTWVTLAGVMGINSNQAYVFSGAGQSYIESNYSDNIAVQITASVIGDFRPLYFRLTDVNNFLAVTAVNTTSGYKIQKVSGGSWTVLGTTTVFAQNNDTVRIELTGSTITLLINGVQQLQVVNTFNQTATKHGIGNWTTNSTRWDNFSVETLSSSGTTYIGSGTATGKSSLTSNETLILSEHGTVTGQSNNTSNETFVGATGTTYSASGTVTGKSNLTSSETLILKATGNAQGQSSLTSNEHEILSASGTIQGSSSLQSNENLIQHTGTIYSASGTVTGQSNLSSKETMSLSTNGEVKGQSNLTSNEKLRFFVTGLAQGQSSLKSNEKFISVKQIISRVTLQGSRDLHVILEGNRELHVILKGGVDVPAENQNLTLEAGTDKIIDIPNIVDSTSPLDLTTCLEVHYQAKSGSTVITKDQTNGITVTSPTDLSIALVPADSHGLSGFFKHEVWCVDSNGKKSLLTKGNLIIKPSYADVN